MKKINEPPLIMNYELEIKFRYLIETYRKIHEAVYGASYPVVFNYSDFRIMLDYIINEISEINTDRSEIQKCLEAIDYE